MYYRNLVAAMGNPNAAEAWRVACELDAECVTLCSHVQELAASNAEMREGRQRMKDWLDNVRTSLGEACAAQRRAAEHLEQTTDAGHEASIALLREQARSRIARRDALNYGLGLLCVLSAIVIGILAGALMVL